MFTALLSYKISFIRLYRQKKCLTLFLFCYEQNNVQCALNNNKMPMPLLYYILHEKKKCANFSNLFYQIYKLDIVRGEKVFLHKPLNPVCAS